MKIRVVKNAWWLFWADGMVMFPFLWMKSRDVNKNPKTEYQRVEAKQDAQWNIQLFRHELEHVYQIKRLGVLSFYWKYIKYAIKHKYRDIPFEVAAYDAAGKDVELTKEEQKWWEEGRIVL